MRLCQGLPRDASRARLQSVSAGLLEDDLNNVLQFLGIVELYVGQLVDDLGQVVWTDLVQQAASLIVAIFKTGIMPVGW